METARVTSQGRLTIPKRLREKFRLKAGTKVAVIEQEHGFIVKPLDKFYFRRMAGILGTDGDMLKSLMREKRQERKS